MLNGKVIHGFLSSERSQVALLNIAHDLLTAC